MEKVRPEFPKRAVITAGMPYGNKELHFGHIGGVFIHADAFARFLKDRIGEENVIFVSGTDCYGSPIVEDYRKLSSCTGNNFNTIEEFVMHNHLKQKEALEGYNINLSFFAGSCIEPAAGIHRKVCNDIFEKLYENGDLRRISTKQFYDNDEEVFLNGRQVFGKCPIEGCKSEKAYADECDLGHQYDPAQLIDPVSALSGKPPVMKEVKNWYFSMDAHHEKLRNWVNAMKQEGLVRPFIISAVEEFLKPPLIHIKRKFMEHYSKEHDSLPSHSIEDDATKPSFVLSFENLDDREKACEILKSASIPFRTGKTLTPFRLTGNVEWGVPAASLENLTDKTFWVWPESLWAPISFTKTYLNAQGHDENEWKKYWLDNDARVFQFIGEDNISFYGQAEMSMFMSYDENMPLPVLIANRHVLFLNSKAGSSSNIKPPMALELLKHYTAEQLRAHFLSLGLGVKSVSFQPKAYNPDTPNAETDPVLKEGNLLSNVFNRIARSCFYTAQTYYNSEIPAGELTGEITEKAKDTILEYERLMYKFEFHNVMSLLDTFIRDSNKYWVKNMKSSEETGDENLRSQTLRDGFHLLRVGCVLLHPIAPVGTELIKSYLNVNDDFWSWDKIFSPIYSFFEDDKYLVKEIPPKFDFFKKHESQLSMQ